MKLEYKIPKKWRVVRYNEPLKDGDLYASSYAAEWRRCIIPNYETFPGDLNTDSVIRRRPRK